MHRFRRAAATGLLVLSVSLATMPAFSRAQAPEGEAVEPPEKALKYHGALLRRPSPGYLFDRFFGAWLEASTADQLEAFLRDRAAAESDETISERLLLAFFYAKRGDDAKALQGLEAVVAADASNAMAWFELARARARTLDFQAAVEALEKAAAANPPEDQALEIEKLRGRLLVRAGDSVTALKVWSDLLAAQPDDEDLAEDLIEAQLDEGLLEEAIEASETLIEHTTDPFLKVQRRLRCGDLYQRAENRDRALEAYVSALRQTGTDTWIERQALAQIERLFRQDDDLEGLKTFYAEADAGVRRRMQVRFGEAQLLAQLGETEASLTAWREILRMTPGDRDLREQFVRTLAEAERFDEALRQSEALIEQYPEDAELLAAKAEIEFVAERNDEAVASLRRYLELAPPSEGLFVRVAKRLESGDQNEAAEAVFADALEKWQDGVTVREEHAALLHRSDRREEALEVWRAMAEAGDPAMRLRVARALMTRTENTAALEILRAGVEGDASEVQRAEFLEHAGYLATLADAAERADQHELAARWALEQLRRVTRPDELAQVLDRVRRLTVKSDRLQAEIDRLRATDLGLPVQRCYLAELLEASGDSLSADEVLAAHPAGAQGEDLIAAQRVRLFRLRRDWVAAAQATEALLADGVAGLRSSRLRTMIDLLVRAGDLEAALEWMPEWKKASPGSVTPWLEESRILQRSGRSPQAIEVLRRAVQRFDGEESLRSRLAEYHAVEGRAADAERLYWQLYEAAEKPDAKIGWAARLAELAVDNGATEQLIEKFEERRRGNRQSLLPLLALASVYRVTGDYEERREVLLDATRLRPDDIDLLHAIASIEEGENEIEKARKTLQAAMKIDSSDRSRKRLARLELEFGDEDEGYRMLTELRRKDGGMSGNDVTNLARAMARRRDWEKMVTFIEPAVADHPEDIELVWLLAVGLEEVERENEAVDAFIEVLRLARDWNPPVRRGAIGQGWISVAFEQELGALLPPGAEVMRKDQERIRTVYSYKRWGAPSLPFDAGEVESAALIHLALCAGKPGETKIQDRAARAETLGVELAAPRLFAIWENARANLNRTGISIRPPRQSVYRRFPDELALQSLRCGGFVGIDSGDGLMAEELSRLFDLFAEDYPEVAILMALQGSAELIENGDGKGDEEEQAEATIQRAIDLGRTLDQGGMPLVLTLAMVLGAWDGEGIKVPDDLRLGMSELMVDWMRASEQDGSAPGGAQIWSFPTVVAAVLRSGDSDTAIDLLEAKLDLEMRQRGGAGVKAGWLALSSGYGFADIENPLALMPYPPPELPGVPAEVMGLFVLESLRGYYEFDGGIGGLSRQRIEKVADPLLRALLAREGEFDDLENAALGVLAAQPEPGMAALLMIAGKSAEEGDLVVSARALMRARQLPMTADLRTAIDGALTVAVMEAPVAERDADADLMAAGREAAMRFRQWAKDREQRVMLLGLLEDYGLFEEAERVERQLDLGRQRASQARVSGDIGGMIDGGRRADALRYSLRRLRQYAATWSRSNNLHLDNQAEELIGNLWAYGLQEEALSSLHPGDSTSARRWAEYGSICEALQFEDQALAAFEKVVELRPSDAGYLLRLLSMYLQREVVDEARIVSLVRSLPTQEEFGEGVERVIEQIDDAEKIDSRWALIRAALEVIANPPAVANEKDWSMPDDLGQEIRSSVSGDGFRLYSMGYYNESNKTTSRDGGILFDERGQHYTIAKADGEDDNDNEAEPPLIVKRRQAMSRAKTQRREFFDRYLDILIARPDTARDAFIEKIRTTERLKEALEPLEAEAWRQVARVPDVAEKEDGKEAEDEKEGPDRIRYFLTGAYPAGDHKQPPQRSPEQFLIRQAAERGERDMVTSRLIPEMRKAGASPADLAAAEHLGALHFAPDGQAFIDAALAAMVELVPGEEVDGDPDEADDSDSEPLPSPSSVLAGVMTIWLERELSADLEAVVMAGIDHKGQAHHPLAFYPVGAAWLSVVAERESQGLDDFVARLARHFLGEKEGRDQRMVAAIEEMNDHTRERGRDVSVDHSPLEQFLAFFKNLNDFPQIAFRCAGRVEAEAPGIAAARLLGSFKADRSADAWREVVHRSPFGNDIEGFRTYLMEPDDPHSYETLLSKVLGELREDVERRSDEPGEWLDELDADQFGGGLLLSFLNQPRRYGDPTATASYLAEHLDVVRGAPRTIQREIAALVTANLRAYYSWADHDRYGDLYEWADEFYRMPKADELEVLLTADSWGDIELEGEGLVETNDEFVNRRLGALIEQDPQKGWEVMGRVAQLGLEDLSSRLLLSKTVQGRLANDSEFSAWGNMVSSLMTKPSTDRLVGVVLRTLLVVDSLNPELAGSFAFVLAEHLEKIVTESDTAELRAQRMNRFCEEMLASFELAIDDLQAGGELVSEDVDLGPLWAIFDPAILEALLETETEYNDWDFDPFASDIDALIGQASGGRTVSSSGEESSGELPAKFMLEWAAGVRGGTAANSATMALASRIESCAKLIERVEAGADAADPSGLAATAREYQQAFVALLGESSVAESGANLPPLGLALRLWLTTYLASETDSLVAPEIVHAGVRATADLWRQPWAWEDSDVDLEFVSLDRFAVQPEGADGAWRTTARSLIEPWSESVRRRDGPLNYQASIAMAQVALRLGDESGRVAVARMLRKFGDWVSDEPGMLVVLLESGESARAARMMRETWSEMSGGYLVGLYSPEVEKHLPDFVEALGDDPGMRYFGEVLIALAPDKEMADESLTAGDGPKGAETNEPSPRDLRRAALAKRFLDIEFSDPQMRREALDWLLAENAKSDDLSEVVDAELKKVYWPGLDYAPDEFADRVVRLLTHHLGKTFASGDDVPTVLDEMMTRLEQIVRPRRGSANDLDDALLPAILWRTLPEVAELPEEQAAACLPAFNRLLEFGFARDAYMAQSLVGAQVLVSHFGGDAGRAALEQWRAGLSAEHRDALRRSLERVYECATVVGFVVDGWEEYVSQWSYYDDQSTRVIGGELQQQRLLRAQALAEVLLDDPWIEDAARQMGTREGVFSILSNADVANADEMLKHAEALAAASGRGARVWRDLAEIAPPGQALEYIDRALAAELSADEGIEFELDKVVTLAALLRFEAGRELLDSVRERISDGGTSSERQAAFRKHLQQVEEELAEAEKEAAAEAEKKAKAAG